MLKIKGQKVLYFSLIVIFFYMYFSNSKVIISSVKEALFLCYNTVIPALFIFMVFAFYLSHTLAKGAVGFLFKPVLRLLNIKDSNICSYIILSIIGGSAVGGYFLSLIKTNYNISKNALGVLSILMCNNSPAFIIMAVGYNMLGNYKLGIMIFVSIIISSFITAFVFSFFYSFTTDIPIQNEITIASTLVDSISNSVKAMINICGIVIVAFVTCKVLLLYIHNKYLYLAIISLIEVTTACVTCLDFFGKDIYFFCTILTLTPLSIVLQFKSFFTEKISLKILFLSKLIHIPLTLLILKIIVNFFPYSALVYSNKDNIVNAYWNSAPISLAFFTFCIAFIIFFDKNIGVFTKRKK